MLFRSKGKEILHGINLTIPRGKTLALVGPTGSGKTTTMNLFSRFYDVDSGTVEFDGTDVRKFSLDSVRNHIGIVLQDSILFTGTIADNIRFGKPDATMEEVRSAAQKAQIADFIESLPDGYETKISDEQSFAEQALAYAPEDSKSDYEDDTATLSSDKLYSACPSDIAEWLFDTARAEGDTDCIEGESGYYVVYFISRDTHDEITKNVRHILIPVSDSTDEELVASAQSKAAELLSQFLAGDDTSEEAFEKFSNDLLEAGTASEATKYESVYPGQMVESFENWCYDESRQPGDTGIVDSTYGSHIIFFCGNSEKTYRDVLVENALRQADYSAWFENATKDASYTISSFGIAFTNKF